MRKLIVIIVISIAGIALGISSCGKKHPNPSPEVATADFPAEVGAILVNKCAISGCHNAASYQNCAGLLLDSWAHLFDGSNNGAAIIAYSPDYSPLLYFVNTDTSHGAIAAKPTMPLSTTAMPQAPLSAAEYATLKNWIANGAPDKDGNIPFASNADTRQKIYLTQQGCDLLGVIDAEKGVVMRYIKIGADSFNTEGPHCVRVSSDGAYAYVSFIDGKYVQKIRTSTDEVVGGMTVGTGSWNIVYVAPNDTMIATTDWASDGKILFGNANKMQSVPSLTGSGSGLFVYPHGIASNAAFDTTFITAQYGNLIYRWSPYIPKYKKVSINGNPPVATNNNDTSSPNPHEIIMSPDYSKYFVTCEGTNDVRVLDAHTDAILAIIPVGRDPREMALSKTKPYLFVTCQEDAANPLPGRKGSVYVIDYTTNQLVGAPIYGDFYQPHGIAVDDKGGKVYIASTNANDIGPAPHHATKCGGRAGWYNIYDLNTLKPANGKKYQVTVMPYSAATRFK